MYFIKWTISSHNRQKCWYFPFTSHKGNTVCLDVTGQPHRGSCAEYSHSLSHWWEWKQCTRRHPLPFPDVWEGPVQSEKLQDLKWNHWKNCLTEYWAGLTFVMTPRSRQPWRQQTRRIRWSFSTWNDLSKRFWAVGTTLQRASLTGTSTYFPLSHLLSSCCRFQISTLICFQPQKHRVKTLL